MRRSRRNLSVYFLSKAIQNSKRMLKSSQGPENSSSRASHRLKNKVLKRIFSISSHLPPLKKLIKKSKKNPNPKRQSSCSTSSRFNLKWTPQKTQINPKTTPLKKQRLKNYPPQTSPNSTLASSPSPRPTI